MMPINIPLIVDERNIISLEKVLFCMIRLIFYWKSSYIKILNFEMPLSLRWILTDVYVYVHQVTLLHEFCHEVSLAVIVSIDYQQSSLSFQTEVDDFCSCSFAGQLVRLVVQCTKKMRNVFWLYSSRHVTLKMFNLWQGYSAHCTVWTIASNRDGIERFPFLP